jgi:hypothetical protein
MVNLVATHIGMRPILIRDIEPLEEKVLQLLVNHGWAVKQWETKECFPRLKAS